MAYKLTSKGNGTYTIKDGRKIVLGVPRSLEDCLTKFEEHTSLGREHIQNLSEFDKPKSFKIEEVEKNVPTAEKIYQLKKARTRSDVPKFKIYQGSKIILGVPRELEDCLKMFEDHTGESRETVEGWDNPVTNEKAKAVTSSTSRKSKKSTVYAPNPRVFALMTHNELHKINAKQAKRFLDSRFATPTSPETAEKYLDMAIKYA